MTGVLLSPFAIRNVGYLHIQRYGLPSLRFPASSSGIVLNPKKLTRQSVAFSRDQAPLFFRCTEDLWSHPNYSRLDGNADIWPFARCLYYMYPPIASKHLLDLPTGVSTHPWCGPLARYVIYGVFFTVLYRKKFREGSLCDYHTTCYQWPTGKPFFDPNQSTRYVFDNNWDQLKQYIMYQAS